MPTAAAVEAIDAQAFLGEDEAQDEPPTELFNKNLTTIDSELDAILIGCCVLA